MVPRIGVRLNAVSSSLVLMIEVHWNGVQMMEQTNVEWTILVHWSEPRI